MVLEKILSIYLLEKKAPLAFLLSFLYTFVGIVSAKILFSDYFGIVSLAFTSILILPVMNNLFEDTVNITAVEQQPGIINFLKNNKYLFKVYFFLFFGIFSAFALLAILNNSQVGSFFEQEAIIVGLSKGSRYSQGNLMSIFGNNLLFLLFCLFMSFLYVGGAIFILSWNAFLWGTIFGSIAIGYSTISLLNPVTTFVLSLLTVVPHMVMEVSGYIFGAISGGLISFAIGNEDFLSQRFNKIVNNAFAIFIIAVIFIMLGAFLEANIFPWIESKKSYLTLNDQLSLMIITFLLLAIFLLRFFYFHQKMNLPRPKGRGIMQRK